MPRPQFRLEAPSRIFEKKQVAVFFNKKTYAPEVKNTDWQYFESAKPFDRNPYDVNKYDLHESHYNWLGTEKTTNWLSETHYALNQIHSKDPQMCTNKHFINLYTFNEPANVEAKTCVPNCDDVYCTTMQRSYKPAYPFIMQRQGLPKVPHLAFRRMAANDQSKFIDDNFHDQTLLLQKNKMIQWKSTNPITPHTDKLEK